MSLAPRIDAIENQIVNEMIKDHGWWYWDGAAAKKTDTALDTVNNGLLPSAATLHTIQHNLNIPVENQVIELWTRDLASNKWSLAATNGINSSSASHNIHQVLQEIDNNTVKLRLDQSGGFMQGADGNQLQGGTDKYLIHIREIKPASL